MGESRWCGRAALIHFSTAVNDRFALPWLHHVSRSTSAHSLRAAGDWVWELGERASRRFEKLWVEKGVERHWEQHLAQRQAAGPPGGAAAPAAGGETSAGEDGEAAAAAAERADDEAAAAAVPAAATGGAEAGGAQPAAAAPPACQAVGAALPPADEEAVLGGSSHPQSEGGQQAMQIDGTAGQQAQQVEGKTAPGPAPFKPSPQMLRAAAGAGCSFKLPKLKGNLHAKQQQAALCSAMLACIG